MAGIYDYPPGTYVQGKEDDWIGTVEYLSVNPYGEPCLVIRMIKRSFTNNKGMHDLGWTPIDQSCEFWRRTDRMHHGNIKLLEEEMRG